MKDEEIKAIERCNELIKESHSCWIGITNQVAIQTVLNLIEKQKAEIEKKDKIIDLMAEWLYGDDTSFGYGKLKEINTPEKIIEYFENKVKEIPEEN